MANKKTIDEWRSVIEGDFVDAGTKALLIRFEEAQAIANKRIDYLIDALEDVDAEISKNSYDSYDKASRIIGNAINRDESFKNETN